MSTKLNRQQVSVLIKETIENKLFEHKLKEEVDSIYGAHQDLQSTMLIGMMEELSGKKIPDPTILDEGVWEKAKAMLAKIRLSKSTGAAQQRDALEAAADKAANKQFSQLMGSLKQMSGFDKYPNNESEEEFVGITTAIGLMHQAVSEAHKDGMIETDTANSLISNLKSYADGLEGDLSYSYRYFNEDEDADGDDVLEEEEEELNERAGTNYNKITKFLELMDGGKAKPFQARKVKRVYQSLEKEFKRRGNSFEGMTNKERDLLKMMREKEGVLDSYSAKGEWTPKVDKNWGDTPEPDAPGGGGGGGGAPANPDADLDPSVPDSDGNFSDDGFRDLPDESPDSFDLPVSKQKFSGVGDISGITSLPKLYAKAGSMATLNSWMGGPFLGQLAAFALPAAAIAGIAGLVGKRLMGKSREGSLKKLSGMMAPVEPSAQGTEAPEAAPADDSGRDLEGEKKFADLAADLSGADGTPAGLDDEDKLATAKVGSGAGSPPAAAAAPAAPGATPEPPEEDEEEKKAREDYYASMQEAKRWQKIAGIIKG